MVLPLIAAAIGAGGAALGGYFGYKGVKAQNRATAQSSAEQMDFQERMSNTAFRRSRADYEAAGFNPLLAMNSAASTPGGASYQAQNELAPISSSLTSAIDVSRAFADLKKTRADTDFVRSSTTATQQQNEQRELELNVERGKYAKALRYLRKSGESVAPAAKGAAAAAKMFLK